MVVHYLVVSIISHRIFHSPDGDDNYCRNEDFQRENDPTAESESHVLPSQHTKLSKQGWTSNTVLCCDELEITFELENEINKM